jgi:hypothetical protein
MSIFGPSARSLECIESPKVRSGRIEPGRGWKDGALTPTPTITKGQAPPEEFLSLSKSLKFLFRIGFSVDSMTL